MVAAATDRISTFLLLVAVPVIETFCRATHPSVTKLPAPLRVIVAGVALLKVKVSPPEAVDVGTVVSPLVLSKYRRWPPD